MQERIYEDGRPYAGYERGEKITSHLGLEVGDRIIAVSHQFKAENLLVISRVEHDRVYARYDNRTAVTSREEQCLWDFYFQDNNTCDYYHAVPIAK